MGTERIPPDLPDPVEALKYHMDQNGLQPRDLIPFIGSRNRVHEVLNRRRSLTLKMIWRLHEGLGIPAESLIKLGPARAARAPTRRDSIFHSRRPEPDRWRVTAVEWVLDHSMSSSGLRDGNRGLSLTLAKIRIEPIMGQLRNPHPCEILDARYYRQYGPASV